MNNKNLIKLCDCVLQRKLWICNCMVPSSSVMVPKLYLMLHKIYHDSPVTEVRKFTLHYSITLINLQPYMAMKLTFYSSMQHLYIPQSLRSPSVHVTLAYTYHGHHILPFIICEHMTLIHNIAYLQCGARSGLPQLDALRLHLRAFLSK